MSETLKVLDQRWRSTCKSILGQEVGGLQEFEGWLNERLEPGSVHNSILSSKDITSSPTDYCKGAKWISYDEIDFAKKFSPLNINEIKDIDSILSAIQERIYYTGNLFFGNCGNIEKSSNLNDSFYIYNVRRNGNSKYLAYDTIGRLSEDCFGCNVIGECQASIKSNVHKNKRCLEVWMCHGSEQCYYSFGLENCVDCIFCFNLKSRRQNIGNLPLEKSKYLQIKQKLVSEMAQKLKKEKRLPSLIELMQFEKHNPAKISVSAKSPNEPMDKNEIEKAFLQTTKMVFTKPLEGGIDSYAKWLQKHTHTVGKCVSAASGKELVLPPHANHQYLPKNRLLSLREALEFGEKNSISEGQAQNLSLENAHEIISPLAFFSVEVLRGINKNNINSTYLFDSTNSYASSVVVYSKYIGYSFWPRSCEYLFGVDSPFDSRFSLNIYSCTNITRSFEIDCCGFCSDSYFCHNCENLAEAMFCFNVKNMRYAIGNAQLPPPDYKKIKEMLLEQMHDELSKKKELKYDIYNIGCIGK